MTTTTTTIYDIIDDVNAYLDQVAAESDMTPTEARDAAHTGQFGERGKIAHEVWYAHQYDGIVGDAVERWQGAQLETEKMTTATARTILTPAQIDNATETAKAWAALEIECWKDQHGGTMSRASDWTPGTWSGSYPDDINTDDLRDAYETLLDDVASSDWNAARDVE